jgi:hypothetical protein
MKSAVFKLFTLLLVAILTTATGCTDNKSRAKSVYMLLDTSGTYTKEIKKAQAIINYLLGTLLPGDSLAVARIDSESFSEKDIIAKVTFDSRPSTANAQKRTFQNTINKFVDTVKSSPYTDVTGGVLQGVEFLNETGAGNKFILIFSDMKEDLAAGHVRDFPITFTGINVVAINVTKLRSDNVDPRGYVDRLDYWQERVKTGGGTWRVINNLDNIEGILDVEEN